jgi:hypothetical protein
MRIVVNSPLLLNPYTTRSPHYLHLSRRSSCPQFDTQWYKNSPPAHGKRGMEIAQLETPVM